MSGEGESDLVVVRLFLPFFLEERVLVFFKFSIQIFFFRLWSPSL